MDYMDEKMIKFYQSSEEFFKSKKESENNIMTTKASDIILKFKFEKMIQYYLVEKVPVYLNHVIIL